MTEAQQIYVQTPHREFALTYPKMDQELKTELDLIHSIQITAHKIAFYGKNPTPHWKENVEVQLKKQLEELTAEYEMIYGDYEIPTTHDVANNK